MLNKATIAHITTAHSTFCPRIYFRQCQTLSAAGYKVILISPHTNNEIINGIQILKIKKFTNKWLRILIGWIPAYKTALHVKADLYQFHDPELIFLGILLRLHGKRVIYDSHEDLPEDILHKNWLPKIIRNTAKRMTSLIEKKIANYFSHIITSTPYIKQKFLAHKIKATDIKNYPSVPDREVAKSINSPLCYVGLINAERGLFQMLQLAATMKHTLNLYGKFIPKTLEEKAKQHPGWKYVNYFGHIPHQQIPKVLSQSSIGLLLLESCNKYENSLPLKLFEYMAAGLPIIASNFSLWKEIIEENQCGICVNPHNITEILEAIKLLQNDSKRYLQMSQNGRHCIEKKYNWATEGKKLIDVYQQVLQ